MENKSFDDIIKSKLESFSSEIDPNAWDLFQESEADATFDESVASKLDAFVLDEVPAEFDFLNEEVEGPISFDALIGAKLAGLSVNDNSDWDQFEKILDQDLAFDQEVSNKVAGYEAPLSESQWPKLAAHLEKVEKRRRRIVITKLIEAAVFILFILSIMQLYPIHNITKKSVYRTHGVVQDLNNSKSNALDAVNSEKEELLVSHSKINANNIANDVIAASTASNISLEGSNNSANIVSAEGASFTGMNGRQAIVMSQPLAKRNIASLVYTRDEEVSFRQKESSNYISLIDIPEIPILERVIAAPSFDLGKSVKKDQYWFNVYGSPELSIINTPYDKSYNDDRFINTETQDVEAYSRITDSYSLGASVSKETANWEIEGGIEYTSLNYFPKQVKEVTGKASTGYKTTLLKEIIFDIVEIPVNLKYSLFRKKGWKVYGTNGFSAGIVAFANYDIDEDPSKPLSAALASSGFQGRVVSEESFVDRKTFDEGFLKTENFKENIFASVSAGFGVSKEISDKIAFYVQPTYHYNLSQSGLGPNNDVHHRLALQFGTKVRI
ncbi:hypothetical protein [Portibacter lacus]|uniref:Outer membrane protein beta-barrel domain-containing protein n=1 Tax=Portibacter lacus TaxID=1099794 RepID=A0AA37WF25_9BACT|nr:hypothetical protein [Portibacter lacus]GLR18192.1 hypothetical protein GCM10007940_28070 [Portibacter lacus]